MARTPSEGPCRRRRHPRHIRRSRWPASRARNERPTQGNQRREAQLPRLPNRRRECPRARRHPQHRGHARASPPPLLGSVWRLMRLSVGQQLLLLRSLCCGSLAATAVAATPPMEFSATLASSCIHGLVGALDGPGGHGLKGMPRTMNTSEALKAKFGTLPPEEASRE
ncbi:unnamed protein product [Prorocentrum cordatum]|uniref:Uncharacterized protein n=1 Tax=Prorocentrum cordatum TaxID=2364126 RepID=A0ABN9PBL3_9DINO|nr:unnamed protein product [Polarella glacialis]